MLRPTGRMLTTNINAAAHLCCDLHSQEVVSHPTIDPRCRELYRCNQYHSDPVHLTDMRYRQMFMEFNEHLDLMHIPN